jgi:sialic acid synthase SpsE
MSLKLIAEFGSCHMGKIAHIKEAIDRCSVAGIDYLKLQLFPNEAPFVPENVWLDPEIYTEAAEYAYDKGLILSASVFDEKSLSFLLEDQPLFYKFAFSKKARQDWIERAHLHAGSYSQIFVSCDVMTDHLVPNYCKKLYCIPEYPVRYEIAFDELFPRFDGFSDHTMGIRQTKRAIEAGAKVIEKHVRLGRDHEICPDARFAVTIEEFAKCR